MINEIITKINGVIWGRGTVIAVIFVGCYLSIGTGFLQIRKLTYTFKNIAKSMFTKKKGNGISSYEAMSTALAGTIGVGNIIGVSSAIVIGGAGAVFWLWIGGILGMITKYAEVLLAVLYRKKDNKNEYIGGAMYYLEKATGNKILSVIFCFSCILATFGIGNITQSGAISNALNYTMNVPKSLCSAVCAVFVYFIINGGAKRITKFASKLIPVMAIFYIGGALVVIYFHRQNIANAFSMIFSGAFSFRSAVGGTTGTLINTAMKVGISRGLFTHEAGLGSAPIAHACSDCKNEVEQGLWGIFEVFIDTIVVCTVTSLVVITTNSYTLGFVGSETAIRGFSTVFGDMGAKFVAISIFLFAIGSIVSWNLYGQKSIYYLFNDSDAVKKKYNIIFTIVIVIGGTIQIDTAWKIADIFNGFMMLPNLFGIIILSPVVFKQTNKYFRRKKL